jgi:hypothetical protein
VLTGNINNVELLKFCSNMDKKSRNKLLDKLLDDSRPKKTQLIKQSESMCETRCIYGEIRTFKTRKSLSHSSLLEENTFFY